MNNIQSLLVKNISHSYTIKKYNIELKINKLHINILHRDVDSSRLVTDKILNEGKIN